MRLLLDTHFMIWLGTDPTRILPTERRLINADDTELLVSVVSLWELRIKWQQVDRDGRRKGRLSPRAAMSLATGNPISFVALDPVDVLDSIEPPIDHRDPFDEMLLVHARQLGARLLTRDDKLLPHPLALSAP